jgi:hypothetical protein
MIPASLSMQAAQFMGERCQHLDVVAIFAPHRSAWQPRLNPPPVKPLHHMCSEARVLNVPLIRVGVADGRSEHPQKEWTLVAAENLVVVIAEPQRKWFNVQGCRKAPPNAPER